MNREGVSISWNSLFNVICNSSPFGVSGLGSNIKATSYLICMVLSLLIPLGSSSPKFPLSPSLGVSSISIPLFHNHDLANFPHLCKFQNICILSMMLPLSLIFFLYFFVSLFSIFIYLIHHFSTRVSLL